MDNQVFDLIVYAMPEPHRAPTFTTVRRKFDGKIIPIARGNPKNKQYQNKIFIAAQRMIEKGDFRMFAEHVPLVMSVQYVLARPKSVPVKKRPHHVVTPDLDNLTKAIKDSMKQLVFYDDNQIVRYIDPYLKRYADMDEQPCIKIKIMPYEDWLNERSRIGTGGATTDASRQVSSMAGGTPGEALRNAGEVRPESSVNPTAIQKG